MRYARNVLGLANDYRNDDTTQKIIRSYMALPLLPEDHIIKVYDLINRTIPPGNENLIKLK